MCCFESVSVYILFYKHFCLSKKWGILSWQIYNMIVLLKFTHNVSVSLNSLVLLLYGTHHNYRYHWLSAGNRRILFFPTTIFHPQLICRFFDLIHSNYYCMLFVRWNLSWYRCTSVSILFLLQWLLFSRKSHSSKWLRPRQHYSTAY